MKGKILKIEYDKNGINNIYRVFQQRLNKILARQTVDKHILTVCETL
jgi:hypothetical protein